MNRFVLVFSVIALGLTAILMAFYKFEPVGYYYKWGGGVDDMPDDFECDKPFDLGGCDVYFCRSKGGYFDKVKVMFYKGMMLNVLIMYRDELAFSKDPENYRSSFCYLDFSDFKLGEKDLEEKYMRQFYFKCLGGDFTQDFLLYTDGRVYFDVQSKASPYEAHYEQCYDNSLKLPPNDPAPPP